MAGEKENDSSQSFSPKAENTSVCPQFQLDFFRKMVRKYIDKHLFDAALFWADKVVSLSNEETQDVFWFAHCLYCTRQYHRAAFCIKSRNLHLYDIECRYLAAKCHFSGKEYKEALDVLDVDLNCTNDTKKNIPLLKPNSEMMSAISLLKGRIYEAMDNRGLAAECFRESLHHDLYCFDAFNALVQHQMLSKEEEINLLNSLPFYHETQKDESELAKFLYETQLKKYDKPGEFILPSKWLAFSNNQDVAVVQAERCYYNCDYDQCFTITSSILAKDPFHSACLPIYVSCLMELNKTNALFYLSHKLVDLYPEEAIAWFAVGCYYHQIGKTDAARRYLSKATTLDRVFGPAWLMYGHSFAVENEHDQAMAAYCRASQLMKGCHLPLLYIGLEYGLSNNTKLAEKFFSQALSIAPEDPFVLHEMGVIAFQNQDYIKAYKHFEGALRKIQLNDHTVLPEKWEPLLTNLGHTCRKLRKFEEALKYHEHALILVPQNATTFSAIGFVYSLMGQWSEAVEYFHKALAIQRDDVFSNNMLTTVIEQLVKDTSICDDLPEDLPKYPFPPDDDNENGAAEATVTENTAVSMELETPITSTTDASLSVSMEMAIDTEEDT